MSQTIDLNEAMLPHFTEALGVSCRYLVLYGGAGSGKSWTAAQKMIVRCLGEPGHTFAVFRKVARTLRHSVFARVKGQLSAWCLDKYTKINKSEMTVTFNNGSRILFFGLDDVEKLKSVDEVTSAWIEEATELSQDDLEQISLRIRGKGVLWYKQIMLSFNPISALHWLKKRFMTGPKDPEVFLHHSTYRDNPKLDDAYIKELEAIRKRNPSLAKVYADGLWGVLKGLIYGPQQEVHRSEWPQCGGFEVYGLDFGFNNPNALIHVQGSDVNFELRKGTMYLTEKIYESGQTIEELATMMDKLEISKTVPIWADSASPASIKTLRMRGYNVKPAKKGKHLGKSGVLAGIDLLQTLALVTCPSNVNLNAEFQTYVWEQDKAGNFIDKPLDHADHLLDALRYSLFSEYRQRRGVVASR